MIPFLNELSKQNYIRYAYLPRMLCMPSALGAVFAPGSLPRPGLQTQQNLSGFFCWNEMVSKYYTIAMWR